ncbi:MAG: hypothetical protein HYX67_05440 [Candidatus Melainabacteria bacterium]|nr:hypothetical protein [Candidatus Melainabacteria bacterium]
MPSNTPLQTIEEYLQLSDWHFKVSIKDGSYENFFWLRSLEIGRSLNLLDTTYLPQKPFSVLVTSWDGGDGASIYGKEKGWRQLMAHAISDTATVAPNLNFHADCAHMLIDEPMSDGALGAALFDFEEPYMLDDLDEEHAKTFWSAIQIINPYSYFSYGCCADGFTLVTRERQLYERILDGVCVTEIETLYKNEAATKRARIWRDLGPECGPEICIEPNCNRLRIEVAVRCFIHQLRWGNVISS